MKQEAGTYRFIKLVWPVFFLLFFLNLHNSICQTSKDSINYYTQLAEKKLAEGDVENSLVAVRKVFDAGKNVPSQVYLIYGKILIQKQDWVRALETFEYVENLSGIDPLQIKEATILADSSSKYICRKCFNTGICYKEVECISCFGTGKKEKVCSFCKGARAVCISCMGKGVVKDIQFGGKFHTCVKCHGTGIGECPKCNGSRTEEYFCEFCQGKGKIKVKETCTH